MHRSGTSALAGTLGLLGAGLPKHLLGPIPNPTGHWEPDRLVEINERMLAESGSSWRDWRRFDLAKLPPDRVDAYRSEVATCLGNEYPGTAMTVLKDPQNLRGWSRSTARSYLRSGWRRGT